MTKSDARILMLRAMAHLIETAHERGIRFIVHEFYRTQERQNQMVAQRLSKVSRSQHQDWLAIDLVLLGDKDQAIWTDHPHYHELGKVWREFHPLCRWGGDWKSFVDMVHFEISKKWAEWSDP